MKRITCLFISLLLLVVFSFLLVACSVTMPTPNDNPSNDNIGIENNKETLQYTHTVKIDNEDLFNYYFSFNETNTISSNHNFGTTFGTKSTSTITVYPKLTGFVDYSGYIELKPETESENKSEKVLKNRRISIDYWGSATDTYDVTNETQQNDSTISFSGIVYKYYAVEIIVTYHHEGLSGNKNLSYETISMTKYNYKWYLAISIENQYYRTTSYNDYDYNHRNPIYTDHYYQTYTITPSSQIKGYKEFNNIVLTFDNGVTVALDALGKATYESQEYDVERAIPQLSKIVGCIDFYPPAIYEY